MIDCFTKEVCDKLKYYVYRLVDPRNGQTFYVGKGTGNRVFQHVKNALNNIGEEVDSDKYKQIQDIYKANLEVIHIIHRHGLETEDEAFTVEAAVIDSYAGLTNIQSGHNSDYGVNNAETIQKIYSLDTYEEQDDINYMIIKIKNDRIDYCGGSKYEAVRSAWKVNEERIKKYKYVLCVVNMVVEEVYEVEKWQQSKTSVGRYEFIGKEADKRISDLFKGKRIPEKYLKKGAANPVQYHDIDS